MSRKKRIPKPLLPAILKLRSEYLNAQVVAKYQSVKGKNPGFDIPDAIMPIVEEMIKNYYSGLEKGR